MTETKLEVRADLGVADYYTYRPHGAGPWPAAIVLMDAGGIRPAMREVAARLASNGFFVLLPNLFYQFGDFAPFDPKDLWDNPPERERLMGMLHKLDTASIMRDMGTYLDVLAAEPDARPGPVGFVGYCLGGKLAFTAAGTYPERVGAVAPIHAGGLVTDKPDSPHLLADKIKARVYLGIADNDGSCTPEQQKVLEAALDAAKVHYQAEVYAGAAHGFAMPDFPVFDAAASEKHWERVVSLFREALPHAAT